MPRHNPARSIASESNLALRIAVERDQRGLSYEGLARLMADVGCPIQGSAIYRIEKGDPPRRVTVDELVAFGAVFELSIDEMLIPVEIVDQKEAKRLVSEMAETTSLLGETVGRTFGMWFDYFSLCRVKPEVGEYIGNHWFADGGQRVRLNLDFLHTHGADDRAIDEVKSVMENFHRDIILAASGSFRRKFPDNPRKRSVHTKKPAK